MVLSERAAASPAPDWQLVSGTNLCPSPPSACQRTYGDVRVQCADRHTCNKLSSPPWKQNSKWGLIRESTPWWCEGFFLLWQRTVSCTLTTPPKGAKGAVGSFWVLLEHVCVFFFIWRELSHVILVTCGVCYRSTLDWPTSLNELPCGNYEFFVIWSRNDWSIVEILVIMYRWNAIFLNKISFANYRSYGTDITIREGLHYLVAITKTYLMQRNESRHQTRLSRKNWRNSWKPIRFRTKRRMMN